MKFIAVTAYQASIDLAKEKGSFPMLDKEAFLATANMQGMPEEIREGVREFGIRNALLTSIAPTGTISLYAGNVSSGIEPIFALAYERKVMQKDGSKIVEIVEDYGVYLRTSRLMTSSRCIWMLGTQVVKVAPRIVLTTLQVQY